MKFILVIIPFIFVLSCSQPADSGESRLNIEEEKKVLTYLKEVEWPKAYREQDTVLLDRILGEDFQMIDASGGWYNKKDELEWIKENGTDQDSFFYEIKRLDILANGTAIISGTGHIFNDSLETTYQSSNYLEKRNGTWKAFSSHLSGIKRPGEEEDN